uniref:ATP synthase F0 subunit 6 n=1 Tax=Setodes iuppiter TaxID=1876052 RepID=UPI0022DCE3EE|nr:ATP synthase F0 subunit 6 [Setodes iuppiter]UZZ44394.1 ATP synthase F0 subunit 6 [Setodes iuppiter]
MMTNLFSIFDPSTNFMFNFNLNWISILLAFLFLTPIFWLSPNKLMMIYKNISNSMFKEFKVLLSLHHMNGNSLIFISMFLFMFFNNFLGLMPYIFTATSHFMLNFSLSITLWMSLMIFGWVNNYTMMMAHLIPNSTPLMLTWFMVLIETISNLIRPLTLAIRLMANMMAGHLLLTLLSEINNKLNFLMIMFILMAQILLLTLEISVAIIQSYVFFILSSLYYMEI